MRCKALPAVTHCSSHSGWRQKSKVPEPKWVWRMRWVTQHTCLSKSEKALLSHSNLWLCTSAALFLLLNFIEEKGEIARMHLWTGIQHREAAILPKAQL